MIKKILTLIAALSVAMTLCAQEPSGDYEQLFKEGIAAFDARNFNQALSKFKKVVNMPDTSPAIRNEANEFIKSCTKILNDAAKASKAAKAAQTPTSAPTTAAVPVAVQAADTKMASQPAFQPQMRLFPYNLTLPLAGGIKEVSVECNTEWEMTSKPDWCKVMEVTEKYIKIWCEENPERDAREGEIILTMKDCEQPVKLHLFQEKGMERSGMVYFRTIPGNTLIEIYDSGIYSTSARPHSLKAGPHAVRFLKEGYEPLDTTIVVPADIADKAMVFDVELEPEFGILVPDIILEDTGKKLPDVDFRLNRRPIDISDATRSLSFDEDGVIYNSLYKGGKIPLRPGFYEISVTADGYVPYNGYVTIDKGDDINLEILLQFRAGSLTVVDERNAEGAMVSIDGTNFTGVVGEKMRLPVGEYIVKVLKDGYMLDEGVFDVKIEENGDVLHKAAMTRMVDCLVSTDVQGETVYVNGEMVPYQHPIHTIPMVEGKTYIVRVEKEGYWTYKDSIYVSTSDTLKDLRGISLRETKPLTIKYDEPNVKISLYAKGEGKAVDYAGVIPTMSKDTTLYVPYGKYKVQLTRRFEPIRGRRVAYEGRINFREKRSKFRIQTWSRRNFIALGLDYNIMAEYEDPAQLPVCAYAYFGQFKVFKGMSTDVLKATLFNTTTCSFPFESEEALQPEWTLGASCLFLNYEFRMGGGFCQYGDINMLMTYSWCPPLTFVLPMTHFSGHDAFAGLEVSTRFKTLNMNFRVGTQYVNGTFMCYNTPSSMNADIKECFTESPLNRMLLTASVGIALGGKDAKGRNVLRLW